MTGQIQACALVGCVSHCLRVFVDGHLVEALGDAVLKDASPEGRGHSSISRDDSKHGGHVGVDHA